MVRRKIQKSNSSRARRMRAIRANKQNREAKSDAEREKIDPKPKRRRWRKINVTKNYYFEDEKTPVARTILTTSCLLTLANFMLNHGKTCQDGKLDSMSIGNGKIKFDCVKCKSTFTISQDLGLEQCPYEKALTLSVFASGSGLEVVNNILSTLQIPELSFYKYKQNEEIIFCDLHKAKEMEFSLNAKEEYRLAMEAGDYVEIDGKRIPFITVVMDGGWSKRSYRHSFDSKSGVAVILGARTKKVLWMDTRIKVCAKCSHADRQGCPPLPHQCFKNWNGSAQAMEADIIVEGFRKSYAEHGLLYRYVVGDADSSVFHKIKSTIFYPGGIEIQKIDCVNHGLRCLNSKLHGIAKTTTFGKHQRDVVASRIAQMARDAKGAISHNSKLMYDALSTAVPPAKKLFNDIVNIPAHVFGDHSRCDPYFCKKIGTVYDDPVRGTKIYTFIQTAFLQLAQRSDRLIHNVTSNLAEGFMSQMCKFTSGKRCNQSLSYGYPLRAMAATFAVNYGAFWPAAVYKKFYNASCETWDNKLAQSIAYRQRTKKNVKTKYAKSQSAPKKNDNDYGDTACDTDIDIEVLQKSVESLVSRLQVTRAERDRIQLCTIGQAFNEEWKFQRRDRITASNAGRIFKMRDCTNSSKCIMSLLYPVDITNNENVRRGIDFEPLARRKYEEETGNFVTDCGLFVSLENGVLGASPDGLVSTDGILEIKCVSVRPVELCIRQDKILLQDKDDNTKLSLNRNHHYFFQVIMQLYVCEKSFCDFVIYFLDKDAGIEELWLERIQKTAVTDSLWEQMKSKLVKFFMLDMAPEIVYPRYVQKLPIRLPQYRIDAIYQLETNKTAKAEKRTSKTRNKRPRCEDE